MHCRLSSIIQTLQKKEKVIQRRECNAVLFRHQMFDKSASCALANAVNTAFCFFIRDMSLDVPTPASFSPPNNIGANSAETRPSVLSGDGPAPVPPGFFDGGIARNSARNSNLVGVDVAEDSSLALSTKNFPSVPVAVDIDLGTARPESPAPSDNDR
jgi:hypothetical protein